MNICRPLGRHLPPTRGGDFMLGPLPVGRRCATLTNNYSNRPLVGLLSVEFGGGAVPMLINHHLIHARCEQGHDNDIGMLAGNL